MADSIEVNSMLEDLEKQVIQQIDTVQKVFKPLGNDKLLAPSASGGWSITQCLEHLNYYSRYYIPRIRKAVEQNQLSSPILSFKPGWLGGYSTRSMDVKKGGKMKTLKNYNPPNALDPQQVMDEFLTHQNEMLAILPQARHVDLNKNRIPITIAPLIRFKLGDMLQFLMAHEHRHVEQARRNV